MRQKKRDKINQGIHALQSKSRNLQTEIEEGGRVESELLEEKIMLERKTRRVQERFYFSNRASNELIKEQDKIADEILKLREEL